MDSSCIKVKFCNWSYRSVKSWRDFTYIKPISRVQLHSRKSYFFVASIQNSFIEYFFISIAIVFYKLVLDLSMYWTSCICCNFELSIGYRKRSSSSSARLIFRFFQYILRYIIDFFSFCSFFVSTFVFLCNLEH